VNGGQDRYRIKRRAQVAAKIGDLWRLFRWVPFFGSTRAASILPSRPRNRTAAARRAFQGWPRLRGHPKGLALTGPSTAARSIGSGLEAAGIWIGTGPVVILAPGLCSSSFPARIHQSWRRAYCTSEKDGVRTCRIGKTGMAPIQTAKSNIGAMPHTVLSTNAGTVSHSLPASSTSGARRDGRKPSAFLSVCPLPHSSAHLQLLRSRPDLLCRQLCPNRPAERRAVSAASWEEEAHPQRSISA
jgi:hypothetical protein